MVLLHCPPTSVYQKDKVFDALENLKTAGKIALYSASIENRKKIRRHRCYGVRHFRYGSHFNMFRQKSIAELFPTAKQKDVGIIVRLPPASGLLTGKFIKDTVLDKNGPRFYNRNGETFDKGKTFSGVDYELGLTAVAELKALLATENLIPYALRWILIHDAVSVVILDASKTTQVLQNVKTAELPDLTPEQMTGVEAIYDKHIRPTVHHLW